MVLDLSRSDSPGFGRYYRVAHSYRDPHTGAWEIRWNASDEVPRPIDEPVYIFDGRSWDMKAEASTVFPVGSLWLAIGLAASATVFIAALMPGSIILVPIAWIMASGWVYYSWQYNQEPVRSTKVAAAASVALAVHNACMDRVLAGQVEHANRDYLDAQRRYAEDRVAAQQCWSEQSGRSGSLRPLERP